MTPDQSALKAAAGLLKPAKWSSRGVSGGLIWGECQGSGANPYRVAADTDDIGSKCTCPSRKFPCKHAIALMWLHVDEPGGFAPAETPDWVTEWMGRRRKSSGAAPSAGKPPSGPKSLDAATTEEVVAASDPAAEARRKAAADKRAADVRSQVQAGLDDLELWISDQLRTGLGGFLAEAGDRCRRMAARLVDAKAGALASRLDETPSRLLQLPAEERIDAAIVELGKLTLLARAWRAAPDDPELRREVVSTESREELMAAPDALRHAGVWEVLGEQIVTRRDGLVSVSTWLLNAEAQGPRFALLLDYFPASAGRRSGAFAPGARFRAELLFYPARVPLRALIVERSEAASEVDEGWPLAEAGDPLAAYAQVLLAAPWRLDAPVVLPSGRIAQDVAGRRWWMGEAGALPLEGAPPEVWLGARLDGAAGLWNGSRLTLLAARTNWGRIGFDA
ncbi:SWIM zinc finger family protein [Caulobacter endophyticus]|uniref:SWIM zinc finger family protein n=2 Tax=Caulobacter endophyticus TaxID=2172652 RepID=A0A2T9JIK4_9CAUL|nr:SWIM zinc finger family protein [Caulobacter endophyticus]